jgi:putative transcriptional regulator
MLLSKARRLRFEKEERDGKKLTYERMVEETGLSSTTLARMLKTEPLERIDAGTINALCRYFGCGLSDLLEYVPEEQTPGVTA